MDKKTREAYIDKLDAKLREWNSKIDFLKAKADGVTAEQKIKFNEKLGDLMRKRDDLKDKAGKARKSGQEAWESLEKGMEDAATDLEKGINAFMENLKQ